MSWRDLTGANRDNGDEISKTLLPQLPPVQIRKTKTMKTIRNKFVLLAIVIAGRLSRKEVT
jgi:polyphosphate kinase